MARQTLPEPQSAEFSKRLAESFKAYRVKNNLTQTELAHMSGVSRSIICDVENERTTGTYIGLLTLWQIADTLNLSLDDLVGRTSDIKYAKETVNDAQPA